MDTRVIWIYTSLKKRMNLLLHVNGFLRHIRIYSKTQNNYEK